MEIYEIIILIFSIVISIIGGVSLVITSLSQDIIVKLTEKNKFFATNKIFSVLLLIFFIFIIEIIILIDMTDNLKGFNLNQIFQNTTQTLLLIFACIMVNIITTLICTSVYATLSNTREKYYYLSKEDAFKIGIFCERLILLQKQNEYYICTIDNLINNKRIFINLSELEKYQLHYYYEENHEFFNIYKNLKPKFKKRPYITLIIICTFILILNIIAYIALATISNLINNSSQILNLITVVVPVLILIFNLYLFFKNIKHINNKKK